MMTQEMAQDGVALRLEFFPDAIYTARVDRVTENVNGTVTTRGRIDGYPLGTLILTTSDGRTVCAVEIPEQKKRFAIQNEVGSTVYRLVDVDLTRVENLEGGPSLVPVPAPSSLSQPSHATVSPQSGPLDPVTVDVLIVYTPLARQWADASGGGIANVIAQAMAKAQLALDNSSTFLSLNLVHSEEIAYTEDANSYTNLTRLQNGSDGYMDAVQGLRDLYRADLVSLFVQCEDVGGLGYLLNDINGQPTWAYCLNRVQQTSWTFTMVHEMGHNMGCHHSKIQNFQPGPGLYSYSAGWLWKGSDNGNYCSVMTYENKSYFADGIARTQVAYFSNPAIQHLGAAVGNAVDGDNARTLREIKGVISAYRNPPTVTLSLTGSPLAEAGGVATVTATLSSAYWVPVTVNLAFSGTATLASDYTRSGTSITIPAGSISSSITLTAAQDVLDEANETVVVDIDTVVNGTESGTQRVTATITDDDAGSNAGVIGVMPDQLTYTGTYGGPDPLPQAFVITNTGVAGFVFSNGVTDGEGTWFSSSPSTGRVEAGASVAVSGVVSMAGLTAGVYSITNRVFAPTATNAPQDIVLHLIIQKASQTITQFLPVSGSVFVESNSLSLSATASSGLIVSFASDALWATVSGTDLFFTSHGSAEIVASQGGDGNYDAATAVTNVYTVLRDGDSDGDGMSDWNEYLAGTSPSNPASVFAIKGTVQIVGTGFVIQWNSSSNQIYTLERATNLSQDGFFPLVNCITATPPDNVHTDNVQNATPGYFYRLKTRR
ncbi:MAG: M12 family metallo-peptidase [bacterium]